MRIGLIAALRTETRSLLSRLHWVRKKWPEGFFSFECRRGARELILMETGMGAERSLRGASLLVEEFSPDYLVCFGFGGGLSENLNPGDAIRAVRSVLFNGKTGSLEEPARGIGDPAGPFSVWADVPAGTIVTVRRSPDKAFLAGLLPDSRHPAQVDMETSYLAGFASDRGVSFAGLRAVCDELGFEPNLPLDRLMDPLGRESAWRAVRLAVGNPGMAVRFVRLARRSLAAGKTLAHRVAMLLDE